jgi:hypothetical protein
VLPLLGKKVDYTAFTGYLHLKNDTGKLIAKNVFYLLQKRRGGMQQSVLLHSLLMEALGHHPFGYIWVD